MSESKTAMVEAYKCDRCGALLTGHKEAIASYEVKTICLDCDLEESSRNCPECGHIQPCDCL